jgi:hypothetical protein
MRVKAQRPAKFGVCIDNKGYPVSLEFGKLYAVLPDEEAAKHGYARVIDESGEDYWHSAERFFMLEVPEALARVLGNRSRAKAPRRRNPALQPVMGSRRRQRAS